MTTSVLDIDFLAAVKTGRASAHGSKVNRALPILGCVLVRKSGDKLEVISTDLETVSRGEIRQTFGGEDWAVCVPQGPLYDWLRALEPSKRKPANMEIEYRHDEITKSVKGGYVYTGLHAENLIIRAGNTRATFYGIDAQEFPYAANNLPDTGPLVRHKPPQAE